MAQNRTIVSKYHQYLTLAPNDPYQTIMCYGVIGGICERIGYPVLCFTLINLLRFDKKYMLVPYTDPNRMGF